MCIATFLTPAAGYQWTKSRNWGLLDRDGPYASGPERVDSTDNPRGSRRLGGHEPRVQGGLNVYHEVAAECRRYAVADTLPALESHLY